MPIGPDTDRHGSPRLSRADYDLYRETGHVGDVHPEWGERGTYEYKQSQQEAWWAEESDDLGDLVDPQNDTYVEEGTHGGPLLAAALPLLGRLAGAAATSFGMKAGSNLADKATGGGGGGGSTSY